MVTFRSEVWVASRASRIRFSIKLRGVSSQRSTRESISSSTFDFFGHVLRTKRDEARVLGQIPDARLPERFMPSRFGQSASDLEETPGPVNRVLSTLFGCERLAVGRTQLPFGVPLIAVAQH